MAAAQPAVFTVDQSGQGQGAIFRQRSGALALADSAAPAQAGDALIIYCTGLGTVDPPVVEGTAAPLSPLSSTKSPVTVMVGDKPAQVQFSGLIPGFAGLYQVNVVMPPGVAAGGAVPVALTVAGQTGPPVTIAVQ